MTTEADYTDTIVEAAQMLGYLIYHPLPARTNKGWRTATQGDAGFPDLAIVGHGRFLLVEVKTDRGVVSPEQHRWLDELNRANLDPIVLRVPSKLDAFINYLKEIASC